MTEREIRLSGLSDPQETDLDQYRAVSGLALAGLVVSLASPLALAHPFMWPVPVVGIVICVLALRHIAREAPALIGRKAALAGVAVAVLFTAAAISQRYTYGRLLDKEAQRFAAQWFDLLRQDQREKSFELTRHPGGRSPLDENLPSHYLPGSDERDELNNYLQKPGVQALLALGDKARFRHYLTERRSHSRGGDLINQVYAVTYEEAGERKSFFIALAMTRFHISDPGRAFWQLSEFSAGIRPKALGNG